MTPTIRPLRPSILTKAVGLAIAALLVAGLLAHAAASPEQGHDGTLVVANPPRPE